jgi:chromosomal replication initiation ATPase DnaA
LIHISRPDTFKNFHTGFSNEVIGRLFGGVHYSVVSKAADRVREEMLKDKELSKLVSRLDSHFKA